MIPGGLLCVVEVAVALLTASLPVYRPLFRFFGIAGSTAASSQPNYKSNSRNTSNFLGSQVSTRITGGGNRSSRRGGIGVTDDITLVTHTRVDGEWVRVSDDDDAAGLVPPKNPSAYATTVSSAHSDRAP